MCPNQEEEKRVAYVAMTRAKEILYILCGPEQVGWMWPRAYLHLHPCFKRRSPSFFVISTLHLFTGYPMLRFTISAYCMPVNLAMILQPLHFTCTLALPAKCLSCEQDAISWFPCANQWRDAKCWKTNKVSPLWTCDTIQLHSISKGITKARPISPCLVCSVLA